MLKKTITYADYDGNMHTEDFYFNLSKSELIEMEYGIAGGLSKKLDTIAKSADPTQIIPMLKDIILRAYGKKSDDGKRFIKSAEISNDFYQTEAYSELIIELLSDENAAADFINNLVSVLKSDDFGDVKAKANVSALPSATK